MHGVVNRMRGGRLGISRRWTTRSQRLDQGAAGRLPTDRAGQGDKVLPKTSVMLIMEECNISSAVEALEDAGYEVGIVKRLPDALERLKQTQPALVIVCGRQATETCLALRTETGAPILALLTLAAETDLLAALDAGADDCQPASISNREILMRTRSLLRRGDLRSRQIHQMPGT